MNGGKEMSIGPIACIKAHYIHIDSRVLSGILKGIDYIPEHNSGAKLGADAPLEVWKEVFHYDNYLSRKQREEKSFSFTRTIQTDGVSVCIHYRRPNLAEKLVEEDYGEEVKVKVDTPFKGDYRVIGIDPGRSSLITAAELLEDGKYVTYKLSRAQYYHESGIHDSNKKKDKWNLRVKSSLVDLSKTTTKGTSLEKFKEYLKVLKKNYDILWAENLKKKWGRQKFNTYMGKQKSIQSFLNSLKKSGEKRGDYREIVLAYGDAGFASNGKGELSAPTTSLSRQCSKKYKTKMIDEFRTTQLNYETGARMSQVIEKKSGKAVRGLYWCRSTKDGKFIDRDVNAALNILKCYQTLPARPPGFLRNDPVQPPPPKKVIKSLSSHKKLRRGLPRKRFSQGRRRNVVTSRIANNSRSGFMHSSLSMI